MDKAAFISCSERSRAASALSLPTAPTCTPKKAPTTVPTKRAPADRGSAAPDFFRSAWAGVRNTILIKKGMRMNELSPTSDIALPKENAPRRLSRSLSGRLL